jgi:hypothetical protein
MNRFYMPWWPSRQNTGDMEITAASPSRAGSGAIKQERDYEDGSDNQPKQSAFQGNDPLPC